jgi:hypothetical protein
MPVGSIFQEARRALFSSGLILIAATASVNAQTNVNVRIEADKPINVMTVQAMGVYTDMYDGFTKPIVAGYLRAAGIYTVRYPGGSGSYADLYHWTMNSGSKFQNANPQPQSYYAGENSMAHVAQFLDKLGTAIITVNYGSNMAGSGGGEPAEAAAWVAYANGDPASSVVIGKDSTGYDWKTVGYWATLRSEAPLATDDGMNDLRASHPKPLGIKLWEIGSEVYNNGFYGGDHKSEEDLHAPYPASDKDNEKRKGNANLSPSFYGARVVEFAKAMKAVDPTIFIGASLNLAPDDYRWGPEWNRDVLKAGCASIDFESMEWRADARSGPNYNVVDEAATLRLPEEQLGKIFSEVIYNNKKFCPAGHSPRVAFTQMAPIHWAKVENPMMYGLFAADAFALLAESGTINSDWVELHDPSFLSGSNQPGPGYYGAQMLHIVAFHPGDEFVATTSNSASVAVHATRRTDGALGVLLVNKNSASPAIVKLTVTGGAYANQGSRFDYGPDNLKAGTGVTKTPLKVEGATFTLTVAPYSITSIVLLKAQ